MAHTRPGSFVVPIVSPVGMLQPLDAGAEPTLDFDAERSFFPRRVIGTLAEALKVLHELAATSHSRHSGSTLTDAVMAGLSADLCLSVGSVLEDNSLGDIDVGFRWALTAKPPTRPIHRLSFPAEASEEVKRVGEELRDTVTVSERVLYGYVSSLARDPEDEEGTVTMKALIGRKERRVKLVLNREQYHTASQANDARLRVVAAGELVHQSARTVRFSRVDSFQLDAYVPSPEPAS
jgi:hypothetical protein